jgi:hypothetical protein
MEQILELLKAMQEEMRASYKEMMAEMRTWRKEMKAKREATEVNLDEMKSIMQHEEDPKEDVTVETGRAPNK